MHISDYAFTTPRTPILTPETTTEDWEKSLYGEPLTTTRGPTTTEQRVVEQNQNVQIYENYDTKYNVYDDEPDVSRKREGTKKLGCFHESLCFQIKDPPPPNNRVTAATAPSTVLVIGIIIFAMIAIVLIVIIVLKTRTSGDPNYKVTVFFLC